MTRLREFFSDRWFDLLLWCRYDLSWRVVGFGVGVVAFPVLAAAVLAVLPDGTSRMVLSSPVTLPIEEPAPLEVSTLRSRVEEVLVVGDSLVAGEEDIYRAALLEVGITMPVFDAVVSRGLRRGRVCPAGVVESSAAEVSASPGSREETCWLQGLDVVSALVEEGRLPQVVVMALGTNDTSLPVARVYDALNELREVLAGRRLVLLATASLPMGESHVRWNSAARGWCASDRSCVFLDWFPEDAPQEFFAPDGLHLSGAGSRWRAEALAAALSGGR